MDPSKWMPTGKVARRAALLAALLVCAAGLTTVLRRPYADWAARRLFLRDYERAQATPISTMELRRTSLVMPTVPFAELNERLRELEAEVTGFEVAAIKFNTIDVSTGDQRYVEADLLTPAGADSGGVTIYLPSSAANEGFSGTMEAVLLANRLTPPRAVLVLPLPVAEQRGGEWPILEAADLDGLDRIARQTALDCRRAVEACADLDREVVGLCGFSLGGCLAAGISGIHADAFADCTLTLFAAGGDFELLARGSSHPLTQRFQRDEHISPRHHAQLLHRLDPLTYVARSKVSSVNLIAGWRDEVVPIEATQALKNAFDAAGITCRLELEQGGHPLAEGAMAAVTRMFERWTAE